MAGVLSAAIRDVVMEVGWGKAVGKILTKVPGSSPGNDS